MQPYDTCEEPKHNDVLRPEQRKPGHQPATAHPWRNERPALMAEDADGTHCLEQPLRAGSCCDGWAIDYFIRYDADGFNPRFDGSGLCVQHVKDGQPLTERGAELLAWHRAGRWYRTSAPQAVVVSPSKNPPHSQQTKQVHQYQQKQGRR